MKYTVFIQNEDGSVSAHGGYALTHKDALANIALFHGESNILKIVWSN